jgi:hypothetical protein
VTIPGSETDEEATRRVREVMEKIAQGHNQKVLLKLEETPD